MKSLSQLTLSVIALWAASTTGAPSAADPCSLSHIGKCAESVFFYAVKPNASTTAEGVARDCQQEVKAIECANQYEKNGCIKGGLLIGMYKIIFEGATAEHRAKCEVGHAKNKAYLAHVPCINKVGKKLGDCMRSMSSVLEASAGQAPLTNRVPYTCCSLTEYQKCIQRTISSACSKSHVEYANSVLEGIAGDFQSTICAAYKDKQCRALPKLKLRKAKYTTLVPSLVENLHALG